jgi:hypothetical protein
LSALSHIWMVGGKGWLPATKPSDALTAFVVISQGILESMPLLVVFPHVRGIMAGRVRAGRWSGGGSRRAWPCSGAQAHAHRANASL